MLARSFWLSLRTDGLAATVALVRRHLYGESAYYVFVRHIGPPGAPVVLPAETKGLLVRRLQAADLNDLEVRRRQPVEARTADADVLVAVRQGRIVGAAWYVDNVAPPQPWYAVVEPHLIRPARFTANIFVRPGESGVGWALSKTANEVLGAAGVRSIVSMVGCGNQPSILLARLLGGRVAGRLRVRHRFGRRKTSVEAVDADDETALRSASATSAGRRAARGA